MGSATLSNPAPLPPPPPSSKSSTNELLASLNRTPLFMTDLSESNTQDNDELEALKALAYEGTTLEVAENFRAQGNDWYRVRRWGDAREFYTKALDVLLTDKKEEERKERMALEEILCLNRAACNLELQNYRQTITDCQQAIKLSTSSAPNPKAYYRLINAYLSLSHISEAQTSLSTAQTLFPHSSSHFAPLVSRLELLQQRLLSQERQQATLIAQRTALSTALYSRHIHLTTTTTNNNHDDDDKTKPDLQDAAPHLANPLDPSSALYLPVLVIYPLLHRTDFIKAVEVDQEKLVGQLLCIFPVPPGIDQEGYKRLEDVDVFVEKRKTTSRLKSTETTPSTSSVARHDDDDDDGLLKVESDMTLADVLKGGKVWVVDDMVRVLIVPRGRKEGWR